MADPGAIAGLERRLEAANAAVRSRFPGERPDRQPVHTVYGGAHLFTADTAAKLGQLALQSLEMYAPTPEHLAAVLGIDGDLAVPVYERVVAKLEREPVEDYRLDFEDGYGVRPDHEEDGHAAAMGEAVAAAATAGTAPPFIGIRIKPFGEEQRRRSFRTLDRFLSALVDASGGELPPGFVVTLPKLTSPEHAAVMAELLAAHEASLGLPERALRFEIMVETTQSVFDSDGTVAVRRQVDAGMGRCIAAHFGTYDYTASCQITADHQHMQHPACDFARHVMQVSLAGTGVWLSDGATNQLPVAGNDDPDPGGTVHQAWRRHFADIRHSLIHGFYQGWDLHPAQLPTRYAAVYSFFLQGIDAAGERLRNFVGTAAQATLVGDVFDDAATGQGLLNYFLRAVNSGAISEPEAVEGSGLSLDELRTRSFTAILDGRRRRQT
jgi:citrate lyase beta subunit